MEVMAWARWAFLRAARCSWLMKNIAPAAPWLILALTANTHVEDRYACFEAGMDGFLVKPLDRDKLADALAGLAIARNVVA